MTEHLSYSQVKLWASCPAKYAYSYLDWEPEPLAEPLIFGSAVHKCIEATNYSILGKTEEPPIDEHEKTARRSLEKAIQLAPIKPQEGEFNVEKLAKEAALCTMVWQSSLERLRKIHEAERKYRKVIEVDGEEYSFVARLDAKLDYMYDLPSLMNGPPKKKKRSPAPIVIDYKTASRAWNDLQMYIEQQHEFYAWVLDMPVQARYEVILRPTTKYEPRVQIFQRDITREQMKLVEEEIVQFIRARHQKIRIRNRGMQCSWCSFAPQCLGTQATKILSLRKKEKIGGGE